MAKKSAMSEFWRKNWFWGLVAIAAWFLLKPAVLKIENTIYDAAMSSTSRKPSEQVAVIAIDKKSLDNIGRWPWNRDIHSKLINMLAAAKPKAVGYVVFFGEPQREKSAAYIAQLKDVLAKADPALPQIAELNKIVAEAEQLLSVDDRLAESIAKAGNVILPVAFSVDNSVAAPEPLPNVATPLLLTRWRENGLNALTKVNNGDFPLEPFAKAAAGLGHLVLNQDPSDGKVRSEWLAVDAGGGVFPSFGLTVALKALGYSTKDTSVNANLESVEIGPKLKIPVDASASFNPLFYKPVDGAGAIQTAFSVDSFFDVVTGTVPASKFAGKVVIVGPTASGLGLTAVTPGGVSSAPDVVANVVSSILSEHFVKRPVFSEHYGTILSALIAIFLLTFAGSLKAMQSTGLLVGGALLLIGLDYGLLIGANTWVPLAVPAALAALGWASLTAKNYFLTERGKEQADSASAESNRLLGLTIQGQGRLDEAFDKFRQVPFSPALMDNLWSLALDFERKRQFNKAQTVYEHMFSHDKSYKDLEAKLKRAKTMSETVIFGGTQQRGPGTSILSSDDTIEKPMLGRYQVDKELGKGAMGIVYQGLDPKIGRVVAIKTMALSQEFEGDELQEARERFFREAETAGKLAHPSIVTIFDAGEDQELAYIAMELLKGGDLVPFCKAGNLLPMDRAVSIVQRVADALGYAHEQKVVHRDIKPANIMYDNEKDVVKVTDFGIARVTDSSKTKTGIVLGTPSFMSPEQISGTKVDGRSDLYSLAVTLYQLLTGRLPFVGESMAELMYKIANANPIDPREVRPDIPENLAQICMYGMAKKSEQRYQTGREMAEDLNLMLGKMRSSGRAGGASNVDLSF